MAEATDESLAYTIGELAGASIGCSLFLVLMSVIFLAPISILTAQSESTRFVSLFILTLAVIFLTLLVSMSSSRIVIKLALLSLPSFWLILLWFFVFPQISPQITSSVTGTVVPVATAQPTSLPAIQTLLPPTSEPVEVKVAQITSRATIVVGLITIAVAMISAVAVVMSAAISNKRS
jgi:hypothetical protein